MDQFNALNYRSANTVSNVVKNDYFVTIATLFALIYVSSFVPRLPSSVAKVTDNVIVKFVTFFVVAYFMTRKGDVALISSLAVLAVVLGLKVYVKNGRHALGGMEPMVGGFQNTAGSRQAEVSVNNGSLMENEPLNEAWTQQKSGEVNGITLDWPGYETVSQNSENGEVMAMNETLNVPKEGEIVGLASKDLSALELV